jgi:NAD(P)-dependent dehydrogenase (short-subunit alcohol dehydrogenase family)
VSARTPEKARASLGGMPRVELEEMDLIDPASVDAFAQCFLHSGRALHILINNAGIMAAPRAFPVDAAALASVAANGVRWRCTGRLAFLNRHATGSAPNGRAP